jgi:hypothetical protein
VVGVSHRSQIVTCHSGLNIHHTMCRPHSNVHQLKGKRWTFKLTVLCTSPTLDSLGFNFNHKVASVLLLAGSVFESP